jgi:hypothetical protein
MTLRAGRAFRIGARAELRASRSSLSLSSRQAHDQQRAGHDERLLTYVRGAIAPPPSRRSLRRKDARPSELGVA